MSRRMCVIYPYPYLRRNRVMRQGNSFGFGGFSGFGSLVNEFLEDVLEDVTSSLENVSVPFPSCENADPRRKTIRISEEDDKTVYEIDLPGFTKDEVKVSVSEGHSCYGELMEVSATTGEGETKRNKYASFELTGDSDKAASKLENGVLRIEVPKKEVIEPENKEIPVE